MLNVIKENMVTMHQKIRNLSRKMENIIKNQTDKIKYNPTLLSSILLLGI